MKPYSKILVAAALLALLIVSFWTRVSDFRTMHPYFLYYDEVRQAEASLKLIREKTLDPDFSLYPHFTIYATALVYGGYFLAQDYRAVLATRSLDPVVESAKKFDEKSWTSLKLERGLALFFGLLAVFAFFLLARTLLGNGFGLVAAFLFSLFPLCVSFSHLAKVDMIMVCFIIISWIFQIRLIRRGRTRDYILAGILAGLVFDCKVNAMSMVSLLMCMVIRARVEQADGLRQIIDRRFLAAILAVGLATYLFSPYYFSDLSRALEGVGWMYFSSDWAPYFHYDPHHWWLDKYYYSLTVILPSMVGLPVWILAVMGIALKIIKNDWAEWLLLLANFFAFVYIFDSTAGSYYYYLFFSALPYIALFAAAFLKWCFQKSSRPGKALVLAVVVLLMIGGLARFRFYDLMNFQAYDQAGRYLSGNLRPGSRVLCFSVYLPGAGLDRLAIKEAWPQDLSKAMVEKEKPDYILIDRWNFAGFEKIYREQLPVARSLQELLSGQWGYRPAQRFAVRYPGDYFYQALDPEFVVELDLLERSKD